MWTEMCFDIRPRLHYNEANDLTFAQFVTNKGSRQGKLRSQNLDEACLKRRYSVYLFETTTQGSVLKVLWQKPAETLVKVTCRIVTVSKGFCPAFGFTPHSSKKNMIQSDCNLVPNILKPIKTNIEPLKTKTESRGGGGGGGGRALTIG